MQHNLYLASMQPK